jgi:hypothetical protein
MAKPRCYLVSTTAPGLRFRVLEVYGGTSPPRAQLLGDTGVPFEREISQATLDKYGYQIVMMKDDDAAVPAEQTEA